ncbi:2-phospho-L-lactate guanylyltransferase [Nocardia sp. CDC159]|uniref:Phosphoenolpyruvate guanylyltransferase n=1 Tax=Nocardia pulmonis TaxID=2951408 RepID=A0A9X2E3Z5_9NOCA|nr:MULTISPECIES: 2-phospho-L-lactate guanylyltransferase [Nocardia]MCM6773789.1 2-phospho-L-lactate guanylyltransferase [Nocardia pulmonis]MCM6786676.1 2-phospho-L-lactate guanylyltransferase [Nocardia sp. CDC159]
MRPDAVHAVIAVKNLERAKSRLADRLSPAERARLVLAMLSDTVTAAAAGGLGSVTVVTPDAGVAEVVRALDAHVHPDAGARADGLNAALSDAAAAVRRRHGRVELLALQADLPALRPDELSDMLNAAPARGRSVVADHTGRGTAALLVRDGTAPLTPLFGPDSARRHIESGAKDLAGDWPGLRLDVDTAADLAGAIELGVGPATAALLDDIGWPRPVHMDLTRRCTAGLHVC